MHHCHSALKTEKNRPKNTVQSTVLSAAVVLKDRQMGTNEQISTYDSQLVHKFKTDIIPLSNQAPMGTP